jgi:hypothetical protein
LSYKEGTTLYSWIRIDIGAETFLIEVELLSFLSTESYREYAEFAHEDEECSKCNCFFAAKIFNLVMPTINFS